MNAHHVGRIARAAGAAMKGLALVALPQAAFAKAPIPAPVASASAAAAGGGYTPMPATPGIGMPTDGGLTFQQQFSPTGHEALWMHDAILMPVITVISLFVLALLLWVVVRFRRARNPVPSRTSHNAVLEVVWTLVPVLILALIAIPSIKLLANQFTPPPANALTVKATGNQWFWTYDYPDNGGVQVISNILKEAGDPSLKPGERTRTDADGPAHLAADTRMVVPVGEPIRLQTTGADVIHAFAVPSLWFKLDAVPGRINEKVLFVEKPGVYFGQCSELCGVRHGYMPIVVEALPRDKFNAWVLSQGGKIDHQKAAAAPAGSAAAPAATSTLGANPDARTPTPANTAGPVAAGATASPAPAARP